MKQQEANRLSKVVEDLAKVEAFLEKEKVAPAMKKVQAIISKLQKKVDGASTEKASRKPSKYALFVQANFKKVAAENPSKKASDIMKLLGLLYKSEKNPRSRSPSPKRGRKLKD